MNAKPQRNNKIVSMLLVTSLSFPMLVSAESTFTNFGSKLELSTCAKTNTLAMCAITYMNETQKPKTILINTAIQGDSAKYYFITESKGWKKVKAPIKWKSDLLLINESRMAMIDIKWHDNANEDFEKLAKQSIKKVLGKVKIEPTKIQVPFYPFEKNGVVYRICYGTRHKTEQCTITAAANLSSGTVEIEATTISNVNVRNEVIQIIVSLDEIKPSS